MFLAVAYAKSGRAQDAHAEFIKALELNPNDKLARWLFVVVLIGKLRFADALRALVGFVAPHSAFAMVANLQQ
jgi:Flp pilus assembly protein TadD